MALEAAMMGRRRGDQASLFYEFRLDDRIPKDHLLRRIDGFVTAALADVHERLEPYYSEIGRPSVDPELMIRMLIIGYSYGLRSERRLTQEVELHLAYRWFCRLDLDDKVPHHSTSRRTGCIDFGKATCFATYSSASLRPAWRPDSSGVRGSLSMPV
jgi:transposase